MGTTAEPVLRQFGQELQKIRMYKGFSQESLYNRFINELDTLQGRDFHFEDWPVHGRQWMSRLEQGQMVNIPLVVIEAMTRALGCTSRERARLFAMAGRNPLVRPDGRLSDLAVFATEQVDVIYREMDRVLQEMLKSNQLRPDQDQEMLYRDLWELALREVRYGSQLPGRRLRSS